MIGFFIFERVQVVSASYAALTDKIGVIRDERRGSICKGWSYKVRFGDDLWELPAWALRSAEGGQETKAA